MICRVSYSLRCRKVQRRQSLPSTMRPSSCSMLASAVISTILSEQCSAGAQTKLTSTSEKPMAACMASASLHSPGQIRTCAGSACLRSNGLCQSPQHLRGGTVLATWQAMPICTSQRAGSAGAAGLDAGTQLTCYPAGSKLWIRLTRMPCWRSEPPGLRSVGAPPLATNVSHLLQLVTAELRWHAGLLAC